MSDRIVIFDTTLRDGEQSPGCSMTLKEKVMMARQLEKLNVGVIEAGFAAASEGDLKSVATIAQEIKNCTVASLARAVESDLDAAWDGVRQAVNPRIHTFIATSDIHMKHKLKMSKEEVVERAVAAVKYAKKYCGDVEFSAEDATRSDPYFLAELFEKVIKAGATVINIPDTVGYTTPDEYFNFITTIKEHTSNMDQATISVHCHNDLGMAIANTLAAARAGARQFECTINGIGERAGNAALEEIVMAMETRRDQFDYTCDINTQEIMKTSKLLTSITGVEVQPNKAIVGANAFAHESGIHQHGMLNERTTYEIMSPESIGLEQNVMVLGKHSGRHAFKDRLKAMGYELPEEEVNEAFKAFKDLADKKKEVYNRDIEAIVMRKEETITPQYQLKDFVINSGNAISSTAVVTLLKENHDIENVATGDGPVDAAFKAVEKILGVPVKLEDYKLHSVTEGKDALGDAVVKISVDDKLFTGRGLSTDIIEASISAYINAVNKMVNYNLEH